MCFSLQICRRYDQGPPERVTPLGHFTWTVEDDLVLKVDIEDVPFFNAPIYMENKQQIGKIDEIFGNIRDYYVSIKLSDNVKASSFQKDMKVLRYLNYIKKYSYIYLTKMNPELPLPSYTSLLAILNFQCVIKQIF